MPFAIAKPQTPPPPTRRRQAIRGDAELAIRGNTDNITLPIAPKRM